MLSANLTNFYFLIYTISFSLIIIVCILIAVAYYTLLDRKVLAAMQRRQGPNVVGFAGLLQPLADGLKLFVKETIVPVHANSFLFLLAPILTFVTSMVGWAVIPFSSNGAMVNLDTGLLFLFAVSSLGVYGVILSGWSSNSKYAFLGGLRSSAQMVSYEVSLGFIILSVVLCAGSTNLYEIVEHQASIMTWHCWFLWPQCVLFVISAIAETNRAPFDLPEAEAELVAGYFMDYSALTFALFFLAEYSAMLMMATIINILFLGGWHSPIVGLDTSLWFGFKNAALSFFWVHVRATFPRYRFDQLMALGWKSFLPLSIAAVIFTSVFLLIFQGFPYVVVTAS